MESILTKILQLDKSIFYFINKSFQTNSSDKFFSLVTRLGEIPIIIIICILLFILGRYKEKLVAVFILFTSYIAFFLAGTLKGIINRPRPIEIYSDISVIGTAHSPAFPSTHATLIAVIATILCFKYKKLSFVLIPIAIIVGISRIYLGLHYPSDVVGGFIIGSFLSMLFLGIEVLIKNLKDL